MTNKALTPPLEAVLAALETKLNARLNDSVTAKAMLSDLAGSALAVKIQGLNLRVVCHATPRDLQLFADDERPAAAQISGTPLNLMQLLRTDAGQALRSNTVTLEGDTETAEAFQALFDLIRPELEEELASVLGDPVARQLTLLANSFKSWTEGVATTLTRSTGEYLREESGQLPTQPEVAEFCREVDELTLAVDRAAARLQEYAHSRLDRQSDDAS